MEFKKYHSLTNHYQIEKDRELSKFLYDNELKNKQFYATEKIDGSNISIQIDVKNAEYKLGKRTAFVEPDDKQFSNLFNLVNDDLVNTITYETLKLYPQTKFIYVYGEIFGGKIQRAQYDISKQGKQAIVLYDIIIGVNPEIHLGMNELMKIIPNQYQPHFVKQGTLKELIDAEVDENSFYGGINEGYVYKPVKTEIGFTGVKHKTDIYNENKHVSKKPRQTINLTELDLDIDRYITENRLMNVVSHGVELSYSNFGELMKEFSLDVYNEYIRDNKDKFNNAEDVKYSIHKKLSKRMAATVRKTIEKYG